MSNNIQQAIKEANMVIKYPPGHPRDGRDVTNLWDRRRKYVKDKLSFIDYVVFLLLYVELIEEESNG